MTIDMIWVWIVVIIMTVIFQNHFTETKTTWEVSYTYTNENMEYIAYGQMTITNPGSSLPWMSARDFIAQTVMADNGNNVPVEVTILNTQRGTDERVILPFWKHLSWYN